MEEQKELEKPAVEVAAEEPKETIQVSIGDEPAPEPEVPPVIVHIHNDGEQTTRIHKIERGPDGEMLAAEIIKGGRRKEIEQSEDEGEDA